MKLWAMPGRATQDRWVIVKSSDKTQSIYCGERNGSPVQDSCLENPMDSMTRQKDMMLENKQPLPPGWKVSIMLLGRTESNSNRSSKNETAGPKWEWCSTVGVSGGESKAWCCKEQYCIETWNLRCMNQAKLDVVKQEIARLNINILGIGELQNGQEWENFSPCL